VRLRFQSFFIRWLSQQQGVCEPSTPSAHTLPTLLRFVARPFVSLTISMVSILENGQENSCVVEVLKLLV